MTERRYNMVELQRRQEELDDILRSRNLNGVDTKLIATADGVVLYLGGEAAREEQKGLSENLAGMYFKDGIGVGHCCYDIAHVVGSFGVAGNYRGDILGDEPLIRGLLSVFPDGADVCQHGCGHAHGDGAAGCRGQSTERCQG